MPKFSSYTVHPDLNILEVEVRQQLFDAAGNAVGEPVTRRESFGPFDLDRFMEMFSGYDDIENLISQSGIKSPPQEEAES